MDVQRVEALVKLLHGSRAHELLVEADGWRVSVTKGAVPPRSGRAVELSFAEVTGETGPTDRYWISAPMVGIFRAGSPQARVGDLVEQGQSVGGIESMKILNALVADVDGEITAIPVEDGQPVEYGQPLLQIRREGEP